MTERDGLEAITAHDSGMFEGAFRLAAHTEPGARGPMSAPCGCDAPSAYVAAMRRRYRDHPGARQQMALMAKRWGCALGADPIPVTGPYAEQAREILGALAARITNPTERGMP